MTVRGIRELVGKRWLWQLAAAACGIAFAILAVQHLSGILDHREIDIGNRSDREDLRKLRTKGGHYAALIPDRYRTDLVTRTAVVLEDGKPLPHRQTSISSVDAGLGRFAITPKYAHFKPTDGQDPNGNGRRYTLLVPRLVKPRILWLCFGAGLICLGVSQRCRPPSGATSSAWTRMLQAWRKRPWLEFAFVSTLALAGALVAAFTYADFSNGGLCVMGKPYSDAIGWHEVAANLSEGLGFHGDFSDNRPGYALFQAPVFLVAGDSLSVAKATNVLFLTLGAVFVFYASRRLFSPLVGFVAFAFVLVAPEYQSLAPTLLTELPAYALGALGLYLLALGCAPGDSPKRGWLIFLAGAVLGLSNLARPFTLLALPLLGLAVLYAGIASRWNWKSTFLRGGLLGAGMLVVFFPWALRQKMVNGIWSISINSSELLYGAAMPDGGGKWNPLQFEQAKAAGLDPNDRLAMAHFFSERFGETVRADPADYFHRMTANYVRFLRELTLEHPATESLLALALFLSLTAASIRSNSLLPLLGFPLLWLLGSGADGWRGYELVPAALAVLLLAGGKHARLGILVTLVFLGATGILSALVGNFGLRRGFPIFEWLFVALLAAAALALASAWSRSALAVGRRFGGRGRLPDPTPAAPESRAPLHLAHAFLALSLVGMLAVGVRTLATGKSERQPLTLDNDTRAEAIAIARAGEPALREASPGTLYCDIVRAGDLRWEIPGDHDVGHWSRIFEVRPDARTTVYCYPGFVRRPGVSLLATHFRGKLVSVHPRKPYVLVGLRNRDPDAPLGHDLLVIEALALIPYDPESRRLGTDRLTFPPCQTALEKAAAKNHD